VPEPALRLLSLIGGALGISYRAEGAHEAL